MNQSSPAQKPALQPISGFPMLRQVFDIFQGVWRIGGPPPAEYGYPNAKIQTIFYSTEPDKGVEIYATPATNDPDYANKIAYRFFVKLKHIRGTSELLSFGLAEEIVQAVIRSFNADDDEDEEEEDTEPDLSREAWQTEIAEGETELSYKAWAAAKLAESEEPDEPAGDPPPPPAVTGLPPGAPAPSTNGVS